MPATRPVVATDRHDRRPAGYAYRAFVSYSHYADRPVAVALQRGIEQLGRAWYQRPTLRIFRDDASLTASPSLWGDIQDALERSEWLILLGSPTAASSIWVRHELHWWLENRQAEGILIGMTDGCIRWDTVAKRFDESHTTALPPEALKAFHVEPHWVDLRDFRGSSALDLRNPAFQDKVADFAAALHGIPKETLVGEDIRQQRRWTRLRNTGIALLAALAITAAAMSGLFLVQRNEAQRETALAQAREFSARADADANPFTALVLAVEATQRSKPILPEARSSYARALQRLGTIGLRPDSPALSGSATSFGNVDWPRQGSRFAVSSDQGISIWDAPSRRPVGTPFGKADVGGAGLLRWSPDGTRIASSDGDTNVTIWDVRTRQPISRPHVVEHVPRGNVVGGLAWSPGGDQLAYSERSSKVAIWNAVTNESAGVELVGHAGEVQAISWSPDGGLIATAAMDHSVRIWDAHTGAAVKVIPVSAGFSPRNIVWAPTRARLAANDAYGKIWVWDVSSPSSAPMELNSESWDIAWSPDGAELASAGDDGLHLWDTAKGDEVGKAFLDTGTDQFSGAPFSVAWSPDGQSLVTVQKNGTLRFWMPNLAPLFAQSGSSNGNTFGDLKWSPNVAELAISQPNAVRILNTRTGQPVGQVITLPSSVSSLLAWSRDGRLLAATGDSGPLHGREVYVLNPATGHVVSQLIGHTAGINSLAWSPAGEWLATGSDNGEVWLWEARSGRPIGPVLRGSGDAVVSVTWLDHGAMVGSIDRADVIREWRFADTKLVKTLRPGASRFVSSAAWSPDGSRIATSTGANDPVGIYSLEDEALQEAKVGRVGRPSAVTWSPDRSLIAAAMPTSSPGAVLLLDSRSGDFLASLSTGSDRAEFSPDGKQLATEGTDGSLRLWESLTEDDACRIAIRALGTDWLSHLLVDTGDQPRCVRPSSVTHHSPIPVLAGLRG